MNDLCVGSKLINLAGSPVVKPGSNCDDKVRTGYGHICSVCSVHTQHTKEEFVTSRNPSQPHEGINHRNRQLFRKLNEFCRCTGSNDSSSCIENRFF